MLKCNQTNAITGRRCPSEFRRPWNLRRHCAMVHQLQVTTFRNWQPNTTQWDFHHHTTSLSPPASLNVPRATLSTPEIPVNTLSFTETGPASTPSSPDLTTLPNNITFSAPSQSQAIPNTPSTTVNTDDPSRDLQQSSSDEPGSQVGGKKRKRSIESFDRIAFARTAPPIPKYELTMSTHVPGQPKGVDWLTLHAKSLFDQAYHTRLAEWGASVSHNSTCILIPEEWKGLDPISLVAIFDLENCPTAASTRLRYRHADHVTSFARASAWFSEWPRSGLQWDNFFGSGPFQPMDASHTCHHNSCIIHLVFEAPPINHDRKECHDLAIKLRSEKKEIPHHCGKHDPPCLMQHAALTTNEAYCLQFAMLRQVRGLDPVVFPRPRRHRYSSFTSQLPTRFDAVNPDPGTLTSEPPTTTRKCGKPEFICPFCKKIKGYDSVAGYWGHLVHKHDGLDTERRLTEIRRTAALWREYWDQYSDGGKRQQATRLRLEQVASDDFNWDVVLNWGLR